MNKRSLSILVLAASFAPTLLRGGSVLSTEQARAHLQAGAVLVDVRTPKEFAAKSLPGAQNIPLDTLPSGITNLVANKSQIVLLHCRSGRRSGIAEKELRVEGYTNAFNIGSYEQAIKVVSPDASR